MRSSIGGICSGDQTTNRGRVCATRSRNASSGSCCSGFFALRIAAADAQRRIIGHRSAPPAPPAGAAFPHAAQRGMYGAISLALSDLTEKIEGRDRRFVPRRAFSHVSRRSSGYFDGPSTGRPLRCRDRHELALDNFGDARGKTE